MTPLVAVICSGKIMFQLISVEDVAACVAQSVEEEIVTNQAVLRGGPDYLAYEEIADLIIERLKLRHLKAHIQCFWCISWRGRERSWRLRFQ